MKKNKPQLNEQEIKNLWVFDRNKLLILEALYKCRNDQAYCGCDLTGMLDIPKNLLSYHIKILRDNGLISEVKCGQKKEYNISEQSLETVKTILNAVELI